MSGKQASRTRPQPLHPAVQELRKEILSDLDGWTQRLIHIIDKDTLQDTVLRYNYDQRRLEQVWRSQMRSRGFVRHFRLKSRQTGTTTQTQARNGLKALAMDNCSVVTVAQLEDRASDILKKAKYAYGKLPEILQLVLVGDSRKGLAYRDTNSQQMIISAEEIEAVRSGTHTDGHLSEFSLYKDGEKALFEMSGVIHMVFNTSILIETTGKKAGSFAHHFYKRCKKNLEIFTCDFVGWQEDPATDLQFPDDKTRDEALERAFEYEPLLADIAEIYHLTPGQIVWAHQILQGKCFGNLDKFFMDYPLDDEMCWRSKGDLYFGEQNVTKLERLVANIPFDAFHLDIEHLEGAPIVNPYEDLRPFPELDPSMDEAPPNLIIFARPRPGHDYMMAGDAASGTAGGDPSASGIIDMHTGEQMCEIDGHMQPHQLANVMSAIGRYYNTAMASPEVNCSYGMTCLTEMYRTYGRFYAWRRFDDSKFKAGTKDGWYTGFKTRAMMLALAARVVEEAAKGMPHTEGLIRSRRLVKQMRTFVEDPETGVPGAGYGAHDDQIMQWAIAWICAQQETKGMTDDIIFRLRSADAAEIPKSGLIIPGRVDVADNIAKIKQSLGLEDQFNAIPISELHNQDKNTWPLF